MYLNVLANNHFTKAQMLELYTKRINAEADKLVINTKYGADMTIERLTYLVAKHLRRGIKETDGFPPILNKLYTALNN